MKLWSSAALACACFNVGCKVMKLIHAAISVIATTTMVSSRENPRALCDTGPSFLGELRALFFCEIISLSTADCSAPFRVENDASMQYEMPRPAPEARQGVVTFLIVGTPRNTVKVLTYCKFGGLR